MKNAEFERLKNAKDWAYQEKQTALEAKKKLETKTQDAYEAMKQAQSERDNAKAKHDEEYEELNRLRAQNDAIWGEYHEIAERLNAQIDAYKQEADEEHARMIDNFDRAHNCYHYGDKAEAPYYSQEGYAHQARRDDLNGRVSRLIDEKRRAKEDAEARTVKIDNYAFNSAKEYYFKTKERYNAAKKKFDELVIEREKAREKFETAKQKFIDAKADFDKLLAEIRAKKAQKTSGWSELRHGVIGDNHKVTFKVGLSEANKGQTLIADGHLSEKEFRKQHDHYGPDNKYSGGKERVEEKRKHRGAYNGPGK